MQLNLPHIKSYLKNADYLDWLIGLNIIFFLLAQLFKAFGWFSFKYVALAYDSQNFNREFWHLLTYGFFHYGFIALFFNMLLLFYFGSILLDFTSNKKLLLLYITGVISGGLFFWLSYIFFQDMYVIKSPLLGASAGIMAVMTYIALLLPHYQIKIRFLGYFKLSYVLIFFILFNLLQIPLGNPGGYFAHLGGLAAGFIIYIWDKYFEKKNTTSIYQINRPVKKEKERLDEILDKINKSGYESLSKEEKEELFRQSKK